MDQEQVQIQYYNHINADKQTHSTESEDYNLLLDPLINSIVIRLDILYLQIGYV